MTILRLNRNHPDFYTHLGPVFGSRIVEQATRDRFYDDPDKEWYLMPGTGAASILDTRIKNFWAVSQEAAGLILDAMKRDYPRLRGIVPRDYQDIFRERGFMVKPFRKNFVEVYYLEKD